MQMQRIVVTSYTGATYGSIRALLSQNRVSHMSITGSPPMNVDDVTTDAPRQPSLTEYQANVVNFEQSLFNSLLTEWHEERGIASSASEMILCPSYQRIIAMGPAAIPLILRQLRNEGDDPDHWFWALEIITGEDPIPEDAYGDTVRMAELWLTWGRRQNAW